MKKFHTPAVSPSVTPDKHLSRIARNVACKYGLNSEDMDEFVGYFAFKMLSESEQEWERFCAGRYHEGWLYRCAINGLHDFLRHHQRIVEREVPSQRSKEKREIAITVSISTGSLATQIIGDELMDRLLAAVARLNPAARALFELYVFDGYTLNELADMEKCSYDAIRKRLERARNTVRSLLVRQGLDAEAIAEYLAEINCI